MPPELKSIIDRHIGHQGTIAVIQRAMEERSSHAVQDLQVREMVDDLMEFNRRRGALLNAKINAKLDEGRKHDKDLLTDEEFEGVSVWIKEENSPEKADSESNEHKEAQTLFDQYVHHHYGRR